MFTNGREITAFANARHIMNAEKALHLYIEPWVQAKISHISVLLSFFNSFYLYAHLTVLLCCLAWVYVKRNEVFAFFRNWFLVMNGFAMICFAALPTAPPRLLPTSGMVDTLYLLSPANFQSGPVSLFANPFAAVPSLHIGYAVFVSMTVLLLARGRAARAFAVGYPLLVMLGVIVTGNHFLFDVLAGAVTTAAAYLVTLAASTQATGELLAVTWRDSERT
jgi:hypothetical protein